MNTRNRYRKDISDNEMQSAKRLALRYLKYRPRSCAEMRQYLKGKNISTETVDHLIGRLKSSGFINDKDFAQRWVENRHRFKPKGTYALKTELKQKGIDDDIIESVLGGEDEKKNACAAVVSRHQRWRHLDKADYKKKVFNFLRSRGFSFQTISELSDMFFSNGPAEHL